MQVAEIAEANFEKHIYQNPYPGRGFVIGRSSVDAAWIILYWIMGRSADSRNRRFTVIGNTLVVGQASHWAVADESLLLYEAMLELPGTYLVSNGDQTRTIYDSLQMGKTFDIALTQREREPDAPHYTPRISGMLQMDDSFASVSLSLLKANVANSGVTDRYTFCPAPPPPGFGVGLTTYTGDGTPLPSFKGDPLFLSCQGNVETLLDTYWNALNSDNRVAIAVKKVPIDGTSTSITIRNRF